MARNYEKNFSRLNRLWLEKSKKKEKRPALSALNTTAEISQWLPSIKEEIDFCLKQSQVYCYTEEKVNEYKTRIMHLEREYKSFIRKLKHLDSSLTVVPWTPRPYERRTKDMKAVRKLHPTCKPSSNITFINTPVLSHDCVYTDQSSSTPDAEEKEVASKTNDLMKNTDPCYESVCNAMDKPLK